METEDKNYLKDLLLGGDKARADAPEGLLKKFGLTVEQFARASKLTRASLYYYLGDKKKPSMASVEKMAAILEMDTREMLDYVTPREGGRPVRN